jgi:hypothetical protein
MSDRYFVYRHAVVFYQSNIKTMILYIALVFALSNA